MLIFLVFQSKLLSDCDSAHLPKLNLKMASGSDLIKNAEYDIIKSANDKRNYGVLELTNGMRVLLISDPETDKSSSALDVHVGTMSDPDDIPGLAHFV